MMQHALNALPAAADGDDDGTMFGPAKEAVGIVADPCGQTEVYTVALVSAALLNLMLLASGLGR